MKWFSRKPRNRRLGRGHVLDVKLRTDQVRAARLRLGALALFMTVATVAGLYLLWRGGQWALDRLVYENPTFAIEKIDVATDGLLSKDQLKRWTEVQLGDNLLALDMARVKRNLEMVPAIRSAAVERVMPHTLRLRIKEREPLAQVTIYRLRTDGNMQATVVQLDEEGYVMSLLDPRQRASSPILTNDVLPTLTGVNPQDIIPGRRLNLPQVLAAMRLLAAFEHSSMVGVVDLQQVDISSPDIIEVTTVQRGKITFSVQDIDRQLRRWRDIHDRASRQGKVIASLDLSVPNNIPAIFMDAGPVPQSAPANRNPQPIRRRNV